MRRRVPRESNGGWGGAEESARSDRVIELLSESNRGRLLPLVPIRFGRMMQSPFAFYRGSAAVMAADLANTPQSGLIVQTCGDAHLMNSGGFATPERQVIIDINDLDETLPAPWEWDVKRLVASIAIAGRHIGLSESNVGRITIRAVQAYREKMADYSEMPPLDVWYDVIDTKRVLKERTREEDRGWLAERIDDPPLIFHPAPETALE